MGAEKAAGGTIVPIWAGLGRRVDEALPRSAPDSVFIQPYLPLDLAGSYRVYLWILGFVAMEDGEAGLDRSGSVRIPRSGRMISVQFRAKPQDQVDAGHDTVDG